MSEKALSDPRTSNTGIIRHRIHNGYLKNNERGGSKN
jgi:hypothetical protein